MNFIAPAQTIGVSTNAKVLPLIDRMHLGSPPCKRFSHMHLVVLVNWLSDAQASRSVSPLLEHAQAPRLSTNSFDAFQPHVDSFP